MGRKIAIVSLKGGVGKTTTTLNLGFNLARSGFSTLIVDLDPQGGVALSLNKDLDQFPGIDKLITKQVDSRDAPIKTRENNLSILFSGNLTGELYYPYEDWIAGGGLKNVIARLDEAYDFILLDCPSGIGVVPQGVLEFADSFLVPLRLDAMSYRSLMPLLQLAGRARASVNQRLRPEGILLVGFDLHNEISSEIAQKIWDEFPHSSIFETVIPFSQDYMAAQMAGKPVNYLKGSNPTIARAYWDLADEIVTKNGLAPEEEQHDGNLL